MMPCMTLPIAHIGDDNKLSLKNACQPTDIPQLGENLMSLLKSTADKVIKLQESDVFCKNILQHIGCSKHEDYFQDAMAS